MLSSSYITTYRGRQAPFSYRWLYNYHTTVLLKIQHWHSTDLTRRPIQISPTVPTMSRFPCRSTNYPSTCVAFSCHASSVSFNLKQYLSFSLCFSKFQRVTGLSFCRARVHLMFPHDQTQAMHSWQDYSGNDANSQRSTSRGTLSVSPRHHEWC